MSRSADPCDPACAALLENCIREYDWGSRYAIAELLGAPVPSPRPQAELWIGAHPSAPSRVATADGPVSLAEWIERAPGPVLGDGVVDRFGPRLPFLLKILAAARPLSLQAHPDARQASAGFARENASGLAPDDPARSYRDDRPKPEILCALTPFLALRGFRPLAETRALLARLDVAALAPLQRRLGDPEPERALRGWLEGLLALPGAQRPELVDAVARAAGRAPGEPACRWIVRLRDAYPGDVGVLAPAFLNLVELQPEEALYLPAGELHCYLEGTGVELMANSDNVLRGGLTGKHVDAPELLRTLSFQEAHVERLRAVPDARGAECYATPAAEFALSRLRLAPGADYASPVERGVEILLCTGGEVQLTSGSDPALRLPRGASALVPAAAGRYRVAGSGVVYRAAVPC